MLADEVYRGSEREGGETPTFWGRYERVLVTGGLSKAYGLPGLRIGWVVGPEAKIAELWGRRDYLTISPGTLSDTIARKVLHPDVRPRILDPFSCFREGWQRWLATSTTAYPFDSTPYNCL